MSRGPALPAVVTRQYGLVTRGQLQASGWSNNAIGHARRKWRMVLPEVYLVDDRDTDIDVRATAALLRWPDALLSHVTAAHYYGYVLLDEMPCWPDLLPDTVALKNDEVHLMCARQLRVPPGITAHHCDPGPAVFIRDFRLCGAMRALLDVARDAPLPISVVMLDAVFEKSPWLMPEVASLADRMGGQRNIARAQRAIALSSRLSESVLESLLRLLIVLAGLPSPQLQIPVRHADGMYYADMGYREKRLLIEADGRDRHSEWRKVGEDLVRQNRLVAAGWRVLRFTWAQVMYQPELVIAAIRAALGDH